MKSKFRWWSSQTEPARYRRNCRDGRDESRTERKRRKVVARRREERLSLPFFRRYYSREYDVPFHGDITFSFLFLSSSLLSFSLPLSCIFPLSWESLSRRTIWPSLALPAFIPRSSGRNFSFSVVRQKYEVQVRDAYVLAGNTGVLRCEIPAFVKEYVAVTSWLKDSAFNIYPSAESGECNYGLVARLTWERNIMWVQATHVFPITYFQRRIEAETRFPSALRFLTFSNSLIISQRYFGFLDTTSILLYLYFSIQDIFFDHFYLLEFDHLVTLSWVPRNSF